MGYVTVGICPICGSAEVNDKTACPFPFLYVELTAGLRIKAPMWATYARCKVCGLWYQDERLDNDSLKLFYSSGAYRLTIGASDEDMDREEMDRAKYDAPIVLLSKPAPASHLDVGCSHGHFLNEVGALVKAGIEPDYKRIQYPDIMFYSGFESVRGTFDIVSSLHNLEHVPDPMAYLRAMVDHLAPGGILVLEVPSAKSPGGAYRFAHLFVFDISVIRRMLEQVGMVIERQVMTPHLLIIAKRKEEHVPLTLASLQAVGEAVAV